jgi:hypothetical protein
MLLLAMVAALLFFASVFFLTVRQDRVAAIAGVLFIGLQVLIPIQNVGDFGSLKYIALAICLYLVLIVVLRRSKDFALGSAPMLLFAAYFGLLLITSVAHTATSDLTLYLGILISGLGAATLFSAMNEAERRIALRSLIAIAGAQALYSLAEVIFGLPAIWGRSLTDSGAIAAGGYNQILSGLVRSQGTVGNPLPLALLLLLAVALVLAGHGPMRGLGRNALLVLLIAGCVASGSRSALVVALIFILFGTQRRPWKSLVIGGAGSALILLVAAAAGFFSSDVYLRFQNGSSVSHRSGALESVPRLIENQELITNLFGNGYFSAYSVYAKGLLQRGNFFAVDNQFVMTLVEGGLVTLAVLVALCISMLKLGRHYRMGIIALVLFFATFDLMAWPIGAALFGMMVGLSGGPTGDTPPSMTRTRETRALLKA